MKIRKSKMIANVRKKGTGGTTFRATLPAVWIREMGLDEDVRDLKLSFDGKKIIIENNKEEIEMLNKMMEKAIVEIRKEMKEVGFICNSDCAERFLDEVTDDLVEDECLHGEIEESISDYMNENYKLISEVNEKSDFKGYYYDTDKEYENVDDFEKEYGIGEY